MIDNFLILKKISSTNTSNILNKNSTAGNSAIMSSKRQKCVEIINSIYGSKRKFVPLVYKVIKIQPTSSYEFGYF